MKLTRTGTGTGNETGTGTGTGTETGTKTGTVQKTNKLYELIVVFFMRLESDCIIIFNHFFYWKKVSFVSDLLTLKNSEYPIRMFFNRWQVDCFVDC